MKFSLMTKEDMWRFLINEDKRANRSENIFENNLYSLCRYFGSWNIYFQYKNTPLFKLNEENFLVDERHKDSLACFFEDICYCSFDELKNAFNYTSCLVNEMMGESFLLESVLDLPYFPVHLFVQEDDGMRYHCGPLTVGLDKNGLGWLRMGDCREEVFYPTAPSFPLKDASKELMFVARVREGWREWNTILRQTLGEWRDALARSGYWAGMCREERTLPGIAEPCVVLHHQRMNLENDKSFLFLFVEEDTDVHVYDGQIQYRLASMKLPEFDMAYRQSAMERSTFFWRELCTPPNDILYGINGNERLWREIVCALRQNRKQYEYVSCREKELAWNLLEFARKMFSELTGKYKIT